uniref:ZP domain-containing protein n=1 Tax=Knipowitschia caucasica TaxID=637954 RepID=A0AAV2LUB0_KNICA
MLRRRERAVDIMALTLLLLLMLVTLSSASHFYGGVVTFTAKGLGSTGNYEVEVRSKATFHGCQYQYFSCYSGNCGYNYQLDAGIIDSSSNGPVTASSWCQTETVTNKLLSTNTPFKTRADSCCWIYYSSYSYSPSWSVLASIDIGLRSDTNQPNNSPDIAIVPFLRVPQNCPRTYNLMTFDPDGDVVRCRYGHFAAAECYDCRTHHGFSLNEAECTLQFQSASQGIYEFELVVEDFPQQSITLRYSDGSFVFQVDPPVSSCTEGLYLPKLVSPTPMDGEIIPVQVGKELDITVKAEAQYSTVDQIILTGPLNISKHHTTAGEFHLRWTPIPANNGLYFPICFAVEVKHGSSVHQSEMRCVLVNVTDELVNTVVTCLESSMIVEVEKATLPPLHYDHLRLSDPSNTVCSLQTHSNSTHVVAIIPLNACGTDIEEDDDDLLFKNEITTVDDPTAIITRRHQVEIKFFCQYAKRGNVSLSFSAHRENVTVWDKGFGTFTYVFEIFPDSQFVSRIDPRSYPLEYDVGQRIYMEIQAMTTVNNTEMFVESCSAAPYDNPNYHSPYLLIQNGCIKDPTLVVHQSQARLYAFSIEAFKFIGLHDQVYIGCSVLMCEAGNPNTRCSHGCLPSGAHRRRREAAIETGVHYVSQGPVKLRNSERDGAGLALNLNMNLVFIAGCALATVGMICGLIFYKSRKSTMRYQPLPLQES